MKTIDMKKIFKKAKQTGVSPYVYIKREINYQDKSSGNWCKDCQQVRFPKCGGIPYTRCELIGVVIRPQAEIHINGGCDNFSELKPEYTEPDQNNLSQEENENEVRM